MKEQPGDDLINHPSHYTSGMVETIEMIESCGWGSPFCLGNVIKYVTRAPHKGSMLADLRKARWYLDREISRLEKEQDHE